MRTMLASVARSATRQGSVSASARKFCSASAPTLSSRSRSVPEHQQQQPEARTSLKDLHPLPKSMREQLERSDAPEEPYTATGNSNDPAVHSSRPASQPAEPEVSPKVAAPGLAKLQQGSTGGSRRSFCSVSAPALSSRSRSFSRQQQQPAARTSLEDLHPLPESMREQLENSAASEEPYTATGNSNDPAVHSSRPASQPVEPELSPQVAAPGLVNGASSSPSASGTSSGGSNASMPTSNNSEEWGTSFAGLGERSFSRESIDVLMAPVNEADVEIKPDGLIYLPEIKYRRILNKAFGPGGWGMAPRSETNVGQGIVSREWVLICQGRFVATARGEQEFFKPSGVPTASEGAKSNALMRCCKDLGVSSELWDPRFIRQFRKKHCVEVWAQDTAGKKKKLWRRKDDPPFEYPWKETGTA